MLNFLSTENF